MSWSELFIVLSICHLVGDFALQTEWQAAHKAGGLGRDPRARRALAAHVLTYAAAFLPALVWVGLEASAAVAALLVVVLFVPHAIQDDRRLIVSYTRRVKRADPDAEPILMMWLDQTFHAVALFGAALLASAL